MSASYPSHGQHLDHGIPSVPGGPSPSAPRADVTGREGEGQVLEQVEDFLEKLVADVVDKVGTARDGCVVRDEDVDSLQDLLENLLESERKQEEQERGGDVCQQDAGALLELKPTEGDGSGYERAACAGEAHQLQQRSLWWDAEPIDGCSGGGSSGCRESIDPVMPPGHADRAVAEPTATWAEAVGELDDKRRRRTRRKERTASRTRRRKQRTARSRSSRSTRSRSSRSRSSRSRDDTRSRSRHKHKHKRRRHREGRGGHHHSSSAPLTLSCESNFSAEGPISPRVNPIFLWVKQDECRIVSVVCEDYDRRNRITLTKTTNGWRAIPKTERFSTVLCPKRPCGDRMDCSKHDAQNSLSDGREGEDADEEDIDNEEVYYESETAMDNHPEAIDEDDLEPDEESVMPQEAEETEEDEAERVQEEQHERRDDEESEEEAVANDEGIEEEESEVPANHERCSVNDSPRSPIEDSDVFEMGADHDGVDENETGGTDCSTDNDERSQECTEDRDDTNAYRKAQNGVGEKDEDNELYEEHEKAPVTDRRNNEIDEREELSDSHEQREDKCADMERHEHQGCEEQGEPCGGDREQATPTPVEEQESVTHENTNSHKDHRNEDESRAKQDSPLVQLMKDHLKLQKAAEGTAFNRCSMEELENEGMPESKQRDESEAVAEVNGADVGSLTPQSPLLSSSLVAKEDSTRPVTKDDHKSDEDEKMREKDEDRRRENLEPSVYDLLNLDETDHMVRLPADLEVSLVKSRRSPRHTPQHSPVRLTHTPDLPPIRLSPGTTITPVVDSSSVQHNLMPPSSMTSPTTPKPQQHKFLESLLASPKKSDLADITLEKVDINQDQPLDLGVPHQRTPKDLINASREACQRPSSGSSAVDAPPPSKKPKLDDLTLRNLLNRLPNSALEAELKDVGALDIKKIKQKRASQDSSGPPAKSKLLDLLTVSDMDPLAQLKQVLSDPDLVVPDPLLVPRARLQALVTSPAQEIPRLLAQRPETRVPYSTPSCDSDMCVVSLSHLQSLLQPESKQALALEEYQRQLIEAQMVWLPYIEAAYSYPNGYLPGYDYKTQMELQSALAACWQEAMLKAGSLDSLLNNNSSNNNKNLKPPPPSPQSPLAPQTLPSKVARKPPSPAPLTPPPGHVGTPRHLTSGYSDKPVAFKYPPSYASVRGNPSLPQRGRPPSTAQKRPVPPALPIAGRNSPTLFAAPQRPYEYQQQQQQQRQQQQQMQQQQLMQQREYEKQQQEYHQQLILLQQLQLQQQLLAAQQQQAATYPSPVMSRSKSMDLERVDRPRKSDGGRPPTCKSLLNRLSAQREARHMEPSPAPATPPADSALLAALGGPLGSPLGGAMHNPHAFARSNTPLSSGGSLPSPTRSANPASSASTGTAPAPRGPALDLSGRRLSGESPSLPSPGTEEKKKPSQGAKLKVKNLVDPNAKPACLLKMDNPMIPPASLPPDDVAGTHLWHPLFSSQKSYSSPWSWTTVTVNGE